MKRLAALLVLMTLPGAAQSPIETAELLSLTGNLRVAIRAGDTARAVRLSGSLREALRTARNGALASRIDDEIDMVLGWLPADTETVMVAREPFTLDFTAPGARPPLN